MLMRTLVMGDIHGAHKGLMQCLERCNFDPSSDTLIQIGDIPDGFDEVFECVEQLLTINRLISIRGNHDDWLLDFIENGQHPGGWAYGGKGTILSYAKRLDREIKIFSTGNGVRKTSFNPGDIPLHHQNFFKAQKLYHIDEMNNCFVHGGFNRWTAFHGQPAQNYLWDRDLWKDALQYQTVAFNESEPALFYLHDHFNEIYLGHTPTTNWQTDQPMRAINIFNMDTGSGHGGRLTVMDVETKEYWQSDMVDELYMNVI
jgi:serine/threonine protein phosphatase 1